MQNKNILNNVLSQPISLTMKLSTSARDADFGHDNHAHVHAHIHTYNTCEYACVYMENLWKTRGWCKRTSFFCLISWCLYVLKKTKKNWWRLCLCMGCVWYTARIYIPNNYSSIVQAFTTNVFVSFFSCSLHSPVCTQITILSGMSTYMRSHTRIQTSWFSI